VFLGVGEDRVDELLGVDGGQQRQVEWDELAVDTDDRWGVWVVRGWRSVPPRSTMVFSN